MRDGRVVDDAMRSAIQRSRDTDAREVHIKRRLCAILGVADAAVLREAFLLYSPSVADLRGALEAAIHAPGPGGDGDASEHDQATSPTWRFVSDRVDTLESLERLGAIAFHSLDSAAVPYTYLSLKRLADGLPAAAPGSGQ